MTQQTPLHLSFIIPALNEQALIGKCLHSINALVQNTPHVTAQIIVVDNQSSDNTAQIAKQQGATVISTAPGRIGKARNLGAKIATGQFLCFIDADCTLDPQWITCCFQHFHDPNIIASGCSMAKPTNNATWVETTWYQLAHNTPNQPFTQVQWLPTSNLIVRKKAFDKIQGFDESLITCEDCDLGYRLSKQGQIIQDNRVGFTHLGESQSLKQFFKREMWRAKSNLKNIKKHKFKIGEWPSLIIPPAYLAGYITTAILIALKITSKNQIPNSIIAIPAILATLLPAIIITKKLKTKIFKHAIHAYFLMSLYLAARGLGTFIPAQRVQRD